MVGMGSLSANGSGRLNGTPWLAARTRQWERGAGDRRDTATEAGGSSGMAFMERTFALGVTHHIDSCVHGQ